METNLASARELEIRFSGVNGSGTEFWTRKAVTQQNKVK